MYDLYFRIYVKRTVTKINLISAMFNNFMLQTFMPCVCIKTYTNYMHTRLQQKVMVLGMKYM